MFENTRTFEIVLQNIWKMIPLFFQNIFCQIDFFKSSEIILAIFFREFEFSDNLPV